MLLRTGALTFVDAFYDIRFSYNQKIPGFSISGYSGQLPVTIQNMPEEQLGAVYGSGRRFVAHGELSKREQTTVLKRA